MNTLKTGESVIALLRSILLNDTPSSLPEGISMEDVFLLSRKHMLSCMTYSAIKKFDISVDEELDKKWHHLSDINTAQSIVQLSERDNLFKVLEENEIAFIPLKGCIIKEMYPRPEYREMSDLDILVHKADAAKVKGILESSGYRCYTFDHGKHDSYFKVPFIHVEMHFELLEQNEQKEYEEQNFSCGVIADAWSIAFKKDLFRHEFRYEDIYIHLVIHLYKHFILSGTGIRQVTDLFVMKRCVKMDWDYINREIDNMGLTDFHKRVSDLLSVWYEDAQATEETDELEAYIFDSGSYGHFSNFIENRIQNYVKNEKNQKGSLIRYLWFRLFPSYEEMCRWYPATRKSRFMLPIMWIYRLWHKGRTNSRKAIEELKIVFGKLFAGRDGES